MTPPETAILLTTHNARYAHCALGLRSLLANMGDLADRTRLLEFQLSDSPQEVAERLLAHRPRIIGIGVHVWNADAAGRLVTLLQTVAPAVTLVLGGPEVGFDGEDRAWVARADFVIHGEGEEAFQQLCRALLAGQPPPERLIRPPPPDLARLALPYGLYDDADIAHRVIYVEASRGCPFRCAFCLSALDRTARPFPLEPFLVALDGLLARGARRFKFVDRTFNLNVEAAVAILGFFLDRYRPGLFVHFELVPDRLPERLRGLIAAFPPGALQFEVGIQSFQPGVQALIDRRQDQQATEENLRWLRRETGVHLHTDLIIGLPGEGVAAFGEGFDRLLALEPQEIQVGILKGLRGAPIHVLADRFGMVFNPEPPYDLLYNDRIDFQTLCRLKRFARFWDLLGNSGRFPRTIARLREGGSPFRDFLELSDWLHRAAGSTHGIALERLFTLVHRGLLEGLRWDPDRVDEAVGGDYMEAGRGAPPWLRRQERAGAVEPPSASVPSRQSRHRGGCRDRA